MTMNPMTGIVLIMNKQECFFMPHNVKGKCLTPYNFNYFKFF